MPDETSLETNQVPEHLYYYKAHVTKVYDGDTCTVDIDLGLSIWIRGEKVRLHRINAPEVRGSERDKGKVARDFLRDLVLGRDILLQTVKDRKGKYGRYLGEIWLERTDISPLNVNDEMVRTGHAQYKEY